MTRLELIKKIEDRKKQININIENLAKLSHLGVRTVNRFFAGDDVKLSTIERITNLLGLDFAGNEVVPLKELEKQRAKEKALLDRKSTRLNSSHSDRSRMPSSA